MSIVRLFLLTIPPNRRWKLQTLFRVMNKIALDDYSGTSMQMVSLFDPPEILYCKERTVEERGLTANFPTSPATVTPIIELSNVL